MPRENSTGGKYTVFGGAATAAEGSFPKYRYTYRFSTQLRPFLFEKSRIPSPLSIHSTRNYVAKNENFTSELFIPREREKNLKLRNVNFYRQFYALSAPRKYIYICTKIHLKLTDYYSLQNRDPHKRIPLFSSLSAQSRSSIVTKERKERKDD